MKIFVTTILAAVLVLSSCTTKCTYNPWLWVSLDGFDSSDLTRVVLVSYKKGSNFNTKLKVHIFDSSQANPSTTDTIVSKSYFPFATSIIYSDDYLVYLPNIGKTVKITDISYQQLSGSPSCCWECSNSVNYTMDGVQKHIEGHPPQQHGLYDTDVSITINK